MQSLLDFNSVYKAAFFDKKHRFHVIYGGAGSGKSVYAAQKYKYFMLCEPGHNILITRKTARSSRYSTFALMRQVIGSDSKFFRINKSDMTIQSLVNGNQIMFAGLDDVDKLKSITFENGILTDVWMEEASECLESDFNQLNLRLRGVASQPFNIMVTFNPVDAESWLKKRFFDYQDPSALVLKTTYMDNRHIDKGYKQVLIDLKEKDPTFYKIYALGEWGIIGNKIFTNYVIHDFDYSKMTDIRRGLDFGFNHASAFLDDRYYENEIYICDEFYATQLTNQDLIYEIKNQFKDYQQHKVIADSAEPDRILEFKRAGFSISPCTKGPQSVRAGISWLQSKKIHIHKTNCPNTSREIATYKWREDKNGNATDEPVNFNDDAMAAMRYSIEDWRLRNNEPTPVQVIKPSNFDNERGGW